MATKLTTEERGRLLDAVTGIRLDKLDALETLDEKLALIYQWVKIGHINLKQFKRLTRDVIVADFAEEIGMVIID